MARLLVCLFVALCVAPAPLRALSNHEVFHYEASTFRRSGLQACSICYGDTDCLQTEEKRCRYYQHTGAILQDGDEGQREDLALREQVDATLFDLVEYASSEPKYVECVPFISHYTDCTKDNICTGCKRCECSEEGGWVCAVEQRCTPCGHGQKVDYRLLMKLEETLLRSSGYEELRERVKRSVIAEDHSKYNKLSNWLYGDNTFAISSKNTTFEELKKNKDKLEGVRITSTTEVINPDYIAFEEVLNSIAYESEAHDIKKLPLVTEPVTKFENAANISSYNFNNHVMNFWDGVEDNSNVTEFPEKKATEVVIDLLKSVAEYDKSDILSSSSEGSKSNKSHVKTSSKENDFDKSSTNSIMKRNVPSGNCAELNHSVENNATDKFLELKHNVLSPLNVVISEKEREMNDLHRIRENLINFLKRNVGDDSSIKIKDNKTEYKHNTYFSVFKVKVVPPHHSHHRRSEAQIPDRFMSKLKRDIYEVIRDIVTIKKLAKLQKLPESFRVLIRALKFYIHEENEQQTNFNLTEKNLRIQNYSDSSILEPIAKSIKQFILDILALINAEMPSSNALTPLSSDTKSIIKRIIRRNCQQFNHVLDSTLNFANYNISSELKGIGKKWSTTTIEMVDSTPLNQLYNLKLLHVLLMVDIKKMKDMTPFFLSANTRRTAASEAKAVADMLNSINTELNTMYTKVNQFMLLQTKSKKHIPSSKPKSMMKKKKSFMIQLKKFLRNSKSDILKLLRKKVPKHEIVRHLARKKLAGMNDLNNNKDYSQVVRKWQSYFMKEPRRKRSTRNGRQYGNRIKYILPKYLRGKVNPAILARDEDKMRSRTLGRKENNIFITSSTAAGT